MTNAQEPRVYYLPSFSPERVQELQILNADGRLIKELTEIVDTDCGLQGEEEKLTLTVSVQTGPNKTEKISFPKASIEDILKEFGVKKAEDLDFKNVYTYWFEDKSLTEPVLKLVGISYVPHKKE